MIDTPDTLQKAAHAILTTSDATQKAERTRSFAALWRHGHLPRGHAICLPDRPARPNSPKLKAPADMPKRRKAGTPASKIALLHAIAHIELNAIDLAWDILGRDFNLNTFTLPDTFYDDWIKVADDEAKHFLLLCGRLHDLGAAYGDLPAHDGLWEAALATQHDFAARLAIVPMVLEARGLDVTPNMITMMDKQNDQDTAAILRTIHNDEITHVAAGTHWFDAWCTHHTLDIETHWQTLVRTYFNGRLKPPFNHPSREEAGLLRDWYEPLAEQGDFN